MNAEERHVAEELAHDLDRRDADGTDSDADHDGDDHREDPAREPGRSQAGRRDRHRRRGRRGHSCLRSFTICRSSSTTRGPQRDATSSSRVTTLPSVTAVQGAEAGPAPERLGRLRAALAVGEEHRVRVGVDDGLGRQLRVAGRLRLGAVGDVVEPGALAAAAR